MPFQPIQINSVPTPEMSFKPGGALPPIENGLLLETGGKIQLETTGNLLLET
jgi:hypothetical protein